MHRRALLAAAALYAVPFRGVAQEDRLLPLASDLRELGEAGRRARVPIVLLFSTPGCPYCREVRRNYLVPLQSTPAPAALIREIDITSRDALIDFDGRAITHAQFAERRGIGMAPVVMALDGRGVAIGEPLVGLDAAGFYGAYLDSLLARARAHVATGR